VLRPLEAREARARAELVAAAAAADMAAAPVSAASEILDSLLAHRRGELGRPSGIVFRAPDSTVLAASPERLRHHEPEQGRAGDAAPPPGMGLTRDGRPRFEILARHGVERAGVALGTIEVSRPAHPEGFTAFASQTTLLFLPIAGFASLLAGLVVVRLLVRRLRSLELLAARVTAGDLDVRIADTSGDEIGRLAERLDRMAERLAEARDRLESTDRQRRQLFADITHELATPLTSIRGYAETLLDPAVRVSDDERRRYVEGVLEESRRLDRLIRDLFELARLEAGATTLEREPIDWVSLCRNTIQRFEPRFRSAGLRLDWRPSLHEAWIEADGHRMEEVLENLLANALRYVPGGGAVEMAIDRVAGESVRYRLTISDDGPGVPAAELPHLFERFYRGPANPGSDRDERGSGLGLAIVRAIVERHGGTVNVGTRSPHGLVMMIDLPAHA
jgi:signal transduction histidine kinase